MTSREIKSLIENVTVRMEGNTDIKWFVHCNKKNNITLGNDYIGKEAAFEIQYSEDEDQKYIRLSTLPDDTAFDWILVGDTRYDDVATREEGMTEAVKMVAHHFNYYY